MTQETSVAIAVRMKSVLNATVLGLMLSSFGLIGQGLAAAAALPAPSVDKCGSDAKNQPNIWRLTIAANDRVGKASLFKVLLISSLPAFDVVVKENTTIDDKTPLVLYLTFNAATYASDAPLGDILKNSVLTKIIDLLGDANKITCVPASTYDATKILGEVTPALELDTGDGVVTGCNNYCAAMSVLPDYSKHNCDMLDPQDDWLKKLLEKNSK